MTPFDSATARLSDGTRGQALWLARRVLGAAAPARFWEEVPAAEPRSPRLARPPLLGSSGYAKSGVNSHPRGRMGAPLPPGPISWVPAAALAALSSSRRRLNVSATTRGASLCPRGTERQPLLTEEALDQSRAEMNYLIRSRTFPGRPAPGSRARASPLVSIFARRYLCSTPRSRSVAARSETSQPQPEEPLLAITREQRTLQHRSRSNHDLSNSTLHPSSPGGGAAAFLPPSSFARRSGSRRSDGERYARSPKDSSLSRDISRIDTPATSGRSHTEALSSGREITSRSIGPKPKIRGRDRRLSALPVGGLDPYDLS